MKSPVRKQAEARRDKVKDVLHAMLPSDVGEIRIAPPTEKRERAAVEFQTPYGWVSLRDLSLGYQTLITWMVDLGARLIERYPGSANPLAEPAIVLVDEIDLHLHPKWQRSLMGHLTERFPNTQFIVTAHSPLIVQAATDANIVLLRREGDHVVIDNDVQTVRDWRVDQVLASDLFGGIPGRPPDVAEALEERKRLLAKKKRTPGENRKLRELDERAEALPTAESPEDIEAMEIIRQAAKHLKATEETGG
jgi:predicted ATP-binding protein involved in virulence